VLVGVVELVGLAGPPAQPASIKTTSAIDRFVIGVIYRVNEN